MLLQLTPATTAFLIGLPSVIRLTTPSCTDLMLMLPKTATAAFLTGYSSLKPRPTILLICAFQMDVTTAFPMGCSSLKSSLFLIWAGLTCFENHLPPGRLLTLFRPTTDPFANTASL